MAELAFEGTGAWSLQDFSRQIPAQFLGPLSGFRRLCSKLHLQGRKLIGSGNTPIQTKAEEGRTVSPALFKLCWIRRSNSLNYLQETGVLWQSKPRLRELEWPAGGHTTQRTRNYWPRMHLWVKSLCYLYGPTWPLRSPGPDLFLPSSSWVSRSPHLLPERAHTVPWPEMACWDWQVLNYNCFHIYPHSSTALHLIFPLLLPRPPCTPDKMAPHSQKAHPYLLILWSPFLY